MVQDNSLLDQARYSEQMSLQQLQLAELQKISSSISSGIASSVAGQAINRQTVGSTAMPTNMMSIPDTQVGYEALANAAAVGGLAIKSGVNHMNNAVGVGRAALDRTAGYIENMQKSPFFAYRSIDWTRTNSKQAEYISMQAGHRIENAGLRFASSIGNMGMASLGGAIGSTFGPIGTIVGTVAGSAIGSVGGDQIIKHVGVQQGYEGWLQQNSSRFINMFESNSEFGEGFSRKEGKQLSKTLSKMNTKFFMSDDEMFTMLNQVTDAGLMKSASDMEDFEKKFSGLVDSVKKGAKMLNTSYEEMVNLYGEWNKMGIKTDAERAELTSQIKTLSGITGMTEGNAANVLSSLIKGLAGGTTLDSANASTFAQENLALASTFREKIGGTDSRYEDALRVIENDYQSNDSAVAQAYSSIAKSGYGNQTIKSALAAVLSEDANGNVSVDKDKFNTIMSKLNNNEISLVDVASMGGENLRKNFSRAFLENFSMMDGGQAMSYMMDATGSQGTFGFLNKLLETQASRDGRNMEDMMVSMGITSNRNDAILFSDLAHADSLYGSAINSDVSRQNVANSIRNDASSQYGVSLTQRIKNGWENGWQTVASWMPSLEGTFNSIKDIWTDTDSAMRNGYSSGKKVNIADDEYKDVFNDIVSNADKLDSKIRDDVKTSLTKERSSSGLSKGISSFFDVITSPSKWDSIFSGNGFTNTDLSHDSLSVKKLLKKVEKSKTMSEEDKQSMISNINQATDQTQDMVSGALDVVTALGGRKARESMVDGITIGKITRKATGANSFDDFTDEKVLSRLSLADQKKIQNLAIEQATKQIENQFGKNLDGLTSLVKEKGYANNNERVQKILEGGISKGEIKSLVKELMTASQGGSGESELNKMLGDTTKDAVKNTSSANKNLDKANKNMSDMSDKLDELADTINKAIKSLDKRTNQLEQTMNRY